MELFYFFCTLLLCLFFCGLFYDVSISVCVVSVVGYYRIIKVLSSYLLGGTVTVTVVCSVFHLFHHRHNRDDPKTLYATRNMHVHVGTRAMCE
jgi:hypothetical protein